MPKITTKSACTQARVECALKFRGHVIDQDGPVCTNLQITLDGSEAYTINGAYQLDSDTFQLFEASLRIDGSVDIVVDVEENFFNLKTLILAEEI